MKEYLVHGRSYVLSYLGVGPDLGVVLDADTGKLVLGWSRDGRRVHVLGTHWGEWWGQDLDETLVAALTEYCARN